ncbi:hypothetical protein JG687_00017525 [Phytophthora cactorum]|uniref:Ubiquitin-like protease family profile domain-containing protein n=1 Tax=Phytophthora cactorum TaxID=29920 RepID=A0A8T1TRW0_9STRA|nr:hypothetical protein JG687_00017525 [Phytophthora cactorum]
MPMNINGNHWVCLVVDKAQATSYSYDSLPKALQVVAIHSPIQIDGYNCGLFVCLYFWRFLCKAAGNDYITNGLLCRR